MTDPAPLPDQHTATITDDGPQDVTHPDPDHDGCDFEVYLTADWSHPNQAQVGPWWFYWMDDHWNGTPQPEQES